ncbi:hypothetical protein E3O62_13255 [Cryobacterium sp. TMT2-15-1]|uniref:hypothetical protein n=1 Tax=Cryobacterium sp. TMT2-15-1 TaxID=1259246 RepID=UPI00106B0ADA|nr:hypothetical protein [Cryobacterium sp. TMT2-15-1]TFC55935.1 hypothetical protein E3O62_13255 [Cryobacterium sp. TMT2-15-1]
MIALATAALLGVSLLSGVGSVVAPDAAVAATGNDFDPGNIISDATFYDGQAMSASSVQSFLNSKVATCRSGYICLKDFRTVTPSKAAVSGACAAYSGQNESAADIISRVGIACGVSQKAMLVLIEKEQGLVSDDWPTDRQYRSATGYGCPDTADCDVNYYGFFNQVYSAALQFKYYAANPTRWNHVAGRTNFVRFHPNSACGSSSVLIQNQATAGLYNYTPYQPNGAALANLYGSGDSCSSYGNRNFWRMFSDWFGSPTTSSSLLRTVDNGTVYLVSGKIKYAVPSIGILISLAPLGNVGYVSQSYLDRFTTAHNVGRSLRSPDGTIYFYDSGIKLPFTSCTQAADYGSSCASNGYVQLTAYQIGEFKTGPALTSVLGTVEGSRYYIKAGEKREILDDASQKAAGIPAGFNVLSENAVSALKLGTPIVRDSVFVRTRSTSTYSLLAGGLRYSISAVNVNGSGVGARNSGSLGASSIQLIQNAPVAFTGVASLAGQSGISILASDGRYEWKSAVRGSGLAPVPVAQQLLDAYPVKGVVEDGSLIKSPTSGTVYVLMPTDVRPINSWAALLAISPTGTPVIQTLPDSVIDGLPKGIVALTAGTLVRSPQDATVYLIDGVTSRIPFSNFEFPSGAGINGFVFAQDERIKAYPISSKPLTYGVLCGGVEYVSGDGSLHAVGQDQLSLFPFDYVSMDKFTCSQLTIGIPATAFIRTPDGSLYQLAGGQKHSISSMARFAALSNGTPWMNVPGSFGRLIPSGAAA